MTHISADVFGVYNRLAVVIGAGSLIVEVATALAVVRRSSE